MKRQKLPGLLLTLAVLVQICVLAVFAAPTKTERYEVGTSNENGTETIFLARSFTEENIGTVYVMKSAGGTAVKTSVIGDNTFTAPENTALRTKMVLLEYVPIRSNGYMLSRAFAKHYQIGEKYLIASPTDGLCLADEDLGFWFEYNGSLCYRQDYGNTMSAADEMVVIVDTADDVPHFKAVSSAAYQDLYHGDTYFGMMCGHITCSHPNMKHHDSVPSTCVEHGTAEYWTCPDCGNMYDDEIGVNGIYEPDELDLLPYGSIDKDGDGYCDDCGKSMPVFEKVTSKSEIMPGNKYIAVAKAGGTYYALGVPYIQNTRFERMETLPAKKLTIGSDGTFPYMEAYDRNAMIITLKYIYSSSSWSDGGMRFGFHFPYKGKALLLSYDFAIERAAYAKYGYHITSHNGGFKIADAYSEEWTGDNAYLRLMYEGGSLVYSMHNADKHTEYEVSLYRLVESGTHGGKRYVVRDGRSAVNYDVFEDADENGSALSSVTGIADALGQSAIEKMVEYFAEGSADVTSLCVKAGITLTEKTADAMLFSIVPVAVSDDDGSDTLVIDDAAFSGKKMTVILYTGGFMPETIVHHKQDGSDEVFYPEWSRKPNVFEMGYDNDGNTYVQFDVTEFSSFELLAYDPTGPVYYIDSVSMIDGESGYPCYRIPGNSPFVVGVNSNLCSHMSDVPCRIVIAFYDEEGRMIHTESQERQSDSVTFNVPALNVQQAAMKVFMLTDNMKPCALAYAF